MINFKDPTYPVTQLYKELKILKLSDYISLQNTLFVRDCLKKQIPQAFHSYFKTSNENHSHLTCGALKQMVDLPVVRTETNGRYSITTKSARSWNYLQSKLDKNLLELKRHIAKKAIIEYFLNAY